jgi:Ca-activated chloride channel family protein
MNHWFSNPWAFYLMLGVTPVLAVFGALALRRRRKALARLGNLLTLEMLLPTGRWVRFVRGLIGSLALTLLVAGIAGPRWGLDYSQAAAPGRDLVVVLDLSRSMLAEQPSRLQRAQSALLDLAQSLKERGGHRIALVVFAGRAKVICPLTNDYDHFREAVESADADHIPPEIHPTENEASGTRIGAGLTAALELHESQYEGYQDILLLSDGDDPSPERDWLVPAAEARVRGIRLNVVGVGDPSESWTIPGPDGKPLTHDDTLVKTRLHEESLREIAEVAGGTYIAARNQTLPPGRLFREWIESRAARDTPDGHLPVYQNRAPLFLGGALFFLTVEMTLFLGSRRSSRAKRGL